MVEANIGNPGVIASKEAPQAEQISVTAGYRAHNEGQAQRGWYARFDPVTAESLSYDNVK